MLHRVILPQMQDFAFALAALCVSLFFQPDGVPLSSSCALMNFYHCSQFVSANLPSMISCPRVQIISKYNTLHQPSMDPWGLPQVLSHQLDSCQFFDPVVKATRSVRHDLPLLNPSWLFPFTFLSVKTVKALPAMPVIQPDVDLLDACTLTRVFSSPSWLGGLVIMPPWALMPFTLFCRDPLSHFICLELLWVVLLVSMWISSKG